MAKLFQVTCLVLFLGMICGWRSSYFFNDPFFSSSFDDAFDDDDWFSSPTFEDIDEEFRQMSNFSSPFFSGDNDQFNELKKKLDAAPSVCSTIENIPPSKVIARNNRRKLFRSTNTTTCVKELNNDGMKYIYKEIKIIDDQNKTISQGSYYQSFTINEFNTTTTTTTTTPSNTTV